MVASPFKAQGGSGSRVNGLDCFVQERQLKSPRPCAFQPRSSGILGENVAMTASSCYEGKKKRRLMLNIFLTAIFGCFFESFP